MKGMLLAFAAAAAVSATLLAQSAGTKDTRSERERLIGAWHLVSIGDTGANGNATQETGIKGMLIYTRDGHMSVQLMYPPADSALSNDYVLNGYEASFGSYEVDDAKHTVTHHVEGSVTRGLAGKDLPRAFRFSDDRHLIIQSTRPDEHWAVTWEHY